MMEQDERDQRDRGRLFVPRMRTDRTARESVYLEELRRLLLEFLRPPLVLAGVERGRGRRAGALAVGARADRLHGVVVLWPPAALAQAGARIHAQRTHHAAAAAVGALGGHAHRLHLAEHLREMRRKRRERENGVRKTREIKVDGERDKTKRESQDPVRKKRRKRKERDGKRNER